MNVNSEVGNKIEKPCRAPGVVGRVTSCAPRQQPAGATYHWRRIRAPLPIQTFLEFPSPTAAFGMNQY
jgi:hypothetical protein